MWHNSSRCTALASRSDYSLIQGAVLLIATLFLLINLIVRVCPSRVPVCVPDFAVPQQN
jgi:hypothetical protein